MGINIIDVVILLFIAMGGVIGFKRGFIKETTMFLGLILVIFVAFMLKNPVATFMFEHLPFFDFFGIFKGVSVLNILLYEIVAFFLVVAVLLIILKLFTFISSVIEKILNFTIILGIPSKLLGTVVGLIEGYVIVFLILFFVTQPGFNITIVRESNLSPQILSKTPFLSKPLSGTVEAFNDIYVLKDKFKDSTTNDELNRESLRVLLKHKLVTVESIEKLISSGKLKINGADQILNEYR